MATISECKKLYLEIADYEPIENIDFEQCTQHHLNLYQRYLTKLLLNYKIMKVLRLFSFDELDKNLDKADDIMSEINHYLYNIRKFIGQIEMVRDNKIKFCIEKISNYKIEIDKLLLASNEECIAKEIHYIINDINEGKYSINSKYENIYSLLMYNNSYIPKDVKTLDMLNKFLSSPDDDVKTYFDQFRPLTEIEKLKKENEQLQKYKTKIDELMKLLN